jgi:hypothetical protein
MTLLVLVVLLLVGVGWIFYRVLREVRLKWLAWLAWAVGGGLIISQDALPPSLVQRIVVNVWASSVLLIPAWWLIRWIVPRRRTPPPPRDTYDDLKPIVDDKGRQLFP